MCKIPRDSDLFKALNTIRWFAFVTTRKSCYEMTGEMKNIMIIKQKEEVRSSNIVIDAYNQCKEFLLRILIEKQKENESFINWLSSSIKTVRKEFDYSE